MAYHVITGLIKEKGGGSGKPYHPWGKELASMHRSMQAIGLAPTSQRSLAYWLNSWSYFNSTDI